MEKTIHLTLFIAINLVKIGGAEDITAGNCNFDKLSGDVSTSLCGYTTPFKQFGSFLKKSAGFSRIAGDFKNKNRSFMDNDRPYGDHTSGKGAYMTVDQSFLYPRIPVGTEFYLETPNLRSEKPFCLKFWFFSFHNDQLSVLTRINGVKTRVWGQPKYGFLDKRQPWDIAEVDLPGYADQFQVIFQAEKPDGKMIAVAIDDVSFNHGSCNQTSSEAVTTVNSTETSSNQAVRTSGSSSSTIDRQNLPNKTTTTAQTPQKTTSLPVKPTVAIMTTLKQTAMTQELTTQPPTTRQLTTSQLSTTQQPTTTQQSTTGQPTTAEPPTTRNRPATTNPQTTTNQPVTTTQQTTTMGRTTKIQKATSRPSLTTTTPFITTKHLKASSQGLISTTTETRTTRSKTMPSSATPKTITQDIKTTNNTPKTTSAKSQSTAAQSGTTPKPSSVKKTTVYQETTQIQASSTQKVKTMPTKPVTTQTVSGKTTTASVIDTKHTVSEITTVLSNLTTTDLITTTTQPPAFSVLNIDSCFTNATICDFKGDEWIFDNGTSLENGEMVLAGSSADNSVKTPVVSDIDSTLCLSLDYLISDDDLALRIQLEPAVITKNTGVHHILFAFDSTNGWIHEKLDLKPVGANYRMVFERIVYTPTQQDKIMIKNLNITAGECPEPTKPPTTTPGPIDHFECGFFAELCGFTHDNREQAAFTWATHLEGGVYLTDTDEDFVCSGRTASLKSPSFPFHGDVCVTIELSSAPTLPVRVYETYDRGNEEFITILNTNSTEQTVMFDMNLAQQAAITIRSKCQQYCVNSTSHITFIRIDKGKCSNTTVTDLSLFNQTSVSCSKPTTTSTTYPPTTTTLYVKTTGQQPVSTTRAKVTNPAIPDTANCSFETNYCSYQREGTSSFFMIWQQTTVSKDTTGPGKKSNASTDNGYIISTITKPLTSASITSPLVSPGKRCVTFQLYMSGLQADKVTLTVTQKSVGRYTVLWSGSGNQGHEWKELTVGITAKQNYQIEWKATKGFTALKNTSLAIDEIVFTDDCSGLPTTTTVSPTTTAPVKQFIPGDCTFDTGNNYCGYYSLDTTDFDWKQTSDSSPSGFTGPDTDHSGKGSYLLMDSSIPAIEGDKYILASPQMSQSCRMCYQFYYYMYGNETGKLIIRMYMNGTDEEVWEKSGNQGKGWKLAQLEINGTGKYKLIITGIVGDGYRGDIAIDDFSRFDGPCSDNRTFETSCYDQPATTTEQMSSTNQITSTLSTPQEKTTTMQPTTRQEKTATMQPTTRQEKTASMQPTTRQEKTTTMQPTTRQKMTTTMQPTTRQEMTTTMEPTTRQKTTQAVKIFDIRSLEECMMSGSELCEFVISEDVQMQRNAEDKLSFEISLTGNTVSWAKPQISSPWLNSTSVSQCVSFRYNSSAGTQFVVQVQDEDQNEIKTENFTAGANQKIVSLSIPPINKKFQVRLLASSNKRTSLTVNQLNFTSTLCEQEMTTPTTKSEPPNHIVAIVMPCIAVLVAMIIIATLLVLRRRRKRGMREFIHDDVALNEPVFTNHAYNSTFDWPRKSSSFTLNH